MNLPFFIVVVGACLMALAALKWYPMSRALAPSPEDNLASPAIVEDGPILVRRYWAETQTKALAGFTADSNGIAERGYSLVGQTWEKKGFGLVSYVVALILVPGLIGVPILLYMLWATPKGLLTATYERRGSVAEPTVADAASSPSKACPMCAETIEAAALVCRYCGHNLG